MTKEFAVINGASGGMGSEISYKLAESFNLILLGRNEKILEGLANDLQLKFPKKIVQYYLVDMLNSASIVEAACAIKKQNLLIKALVNSVGVVPIGGVLDITETTWQETFQISFMGCVNLIREFSSLMKKQGGSIVIINGVMAIQPDPNFVVSAAVTGALRNFAKAISKDLINYGIRVNSILPGATQTSLLDGIALKIAASQKLTSKEIIDGIKTSNPLGRLAEPRDIAQLVSFLCSEQASYINGAFVTVDGGAVCSM